MVAATDKTWSLATLMRQSLAGRHLDLRPGWAGVATGLPTVGVCSARQTIIAPWARSAGGALVDYLNRIQEK
jgi:hypothetical protein